MDPLTIALISAGIKTGAGMYSKHRQGRAMESAQNKQEDEQRRLNAIAQLQRSAPQQAALKYKMPKDAMVADVVGQLAGLGGQIATMRGGGGGGDAIASGGQGLSGGVVDPNTLMKPANAYTRGFGQRRAIDTWQPSYLRQ